jgi:hypothetical protein
MRTTASAAMAALSLLAVGAIAAQPLPSAPQSQSELQSVTVEGRRERVTLERRVKTFVSSITTTPYQESLAQWQKEIPICPEVSGLPYEDGEYVLARLSQIARDAGASLAGEVCSVNLRVVVTSVPDELAAEWSKRNPAMFGDASTSKLRQFLKTTAAVRVWYNTSLFQGNGLPCRITLNDALPYCEQDAETAQVRIAALRDFFSVIVVVNANKIKGISMGQLAGYIGMVGLAEIRINAKLGDAPTILQLFTEPANAPPLGLSTWDEAYLKALYHTQHDDRTQLLAIKTSIINEVTQPPGSNGDGDGDRK